MTAAPRRDHESASAAGRQWELTVTSAGSAVVELLQASSGLSGQQLRQAMDKGAVWLQRGAQVRRVRRRKVQLRPGDRVFLYYNPAVLAEVVAPAQLVADLGRYSVWDKPAGMRSQGSRWGDHTTLARWAEKQLQPQRTAFTVHRLDRAASGLMLLAHDKATAAALSALFAGRRIDKRYRVEVRGEFAASLQPRAFDAPLDGRDAHSSASLLRVDAARDRSVLEVCISTGRKHQIRRHLAAAGFPVIGDRLYGEAGPGSEDLRLRACYLALDCPVSGEQRVFELPSGEGQLQPE